MRPPAAVRIDPVRDSNFTDAVIEATTLPAFFSEITALLVASAVVAYICHRLRIMPIVSFLITGAVLGPHALYSTSVEAFDCSEPNLGTECVILFLIGKETL